MFVLMSFMFIMVLVQPRVADQGVTSLDAQAATAVDQMVLVNGGMNVDAIMIRTDVQVPDDDLMEERTRDPLHLVVANNSQASNLTSATESNMQESESDPVPLLDQRQSLTANHEIILASSKLTMQENVPIQVLQQHLTMQQNVVTDLVPVETDGHERSNLANIMMAKTNVLQVDEDSGGTMEMSAQLNNINITERGTNLIG